MKKPKLFSLRVRLFLVIFVVLLPVVVLFLFSASRARERELLHAQGDVVNMARRISAEEELILQEARVTLVELANQPEIRQRRHEACTVLLRRTLQGHLAFRNFGVIDRDGKLRCSALPATIGLDLSDRTYFQRARDRNEFAVGGYQVGRVTGEPSINFGFPVAGEDGEVRAVVFGALGLGALDHFLEQLLKEVPEGGEITTIDEHGIVLARKPAGEEWIGRQAPEYAALRELMRQGRGCLQTEDSEGEPCILACARLPSHLLAGDVYAVLNLPKEVVLEPIERDLRRALTALGITALLGFLILWLAAERWIMTPIKGLMGAAQRLRGGDLSVRSGPPYDNSELGQLAGVFDSMAEDIRFHQDELERGVGALRTSEREHREMIRYSPYGVLRSLPDGTILSANPALVEMLRYDSDEELRTKNTARDIHVGTESYDTLKERHLEEDFTVGLRLTWRCKDGQTILVRLSGRKVRDDAGEILYYESFVENETERRSLEEQLRQAQKLEAVGRLAGGIAHDFNNLLGVVTGYSNMLLEELSAGGPREKAEEIRKAAERATLLTNQLLFFGRRQVSARRVVDLREVVTGIEDMLGSLMGDKVRLKVLRADDSCRSNVDPHQIEHVVVNLVVNARDAMPEGGDVELEVACVRLDGPLDHTAGTIPDGDYVRLSASDSGLGMDPETRDRIFEPFFTTKEPGKGTGLGLSTSYGIIQQHGGYIRVLSEVQRGTTFEIYLPRTCGEVEEPPCREPAPPGTGTETILLVEDEDALRTMGKKLLEMNGYHVLEAGAPDRALELSMNFSRCIHLVVSDVVMPQMSGHEVAKRIRVQRPNVKVLLTSGYTDAQVGDEDVEGAGIQFIAKPFTPEELLAKVRELLDEGAGG